MRSKWHASISFIKSGIRIISCLIAIITQNVAALALGFLGAEMLGIMEELGDKR